MHGSRSDVELWARVARGGVAELRELVDRHCASEDERQTVLLAGATAMERQAARAGGAPQLVATARAARTLASLELPPLNGSVQRMRVSDLTAEATSATTMAVNWLYSPQTPVGLASLAIVTNGPGVDLTQAVQPQGGVWPTSVALSSPGFQTGSLYSVSALVVDALGPLPAPAQIVMPFLPTSSSVAPPTLVTADTKGIYNGLQLAWLVPAAGVPESYVLTVAGLGPELRRRVEPGTPGQTQIWQIDGLVSGALYTVTVQAVANGLLSIPAVSIITAGLPGTPLAEQVDALSAAPIGFVSPDLAALRQQAGRQLDRVDAAAGKLSYQALRDRAAVAAERSLVLDRTIVGLQQQVLDKGTAAQGLFNADVLSVLSTLADVTKDIGGIPTDIDVARAIDDLAGAVKDAAVMSAVLAWLATHDALELWMGLLEALFKDVASASRSFEHTGEFIDSQYSSLQAAIVPFVEEQRVNTEAEIERLIAPLRAAMAGLVGATQTQVAAVFRAFDMPLNLAVTEDGSTALPDVDPTARQLATLSNVVDQVAGQLKAQVTDALDAVLDAASENGREIVRAIVIAYIVAPIAAALVVALLGGGIGAVVIAAALVIAAEELVHLIVGWIAGPLQDKLDELLEGVAGARRALARALGATTGALPLVAETDLLTSTLELLATELQQLSELLPAAAVQEAIGTLSDARDELVARGTFAAQAAERAAGRANATAFDVIARTYAAPPRLRGSQMPGLDDPNLFAGARILAGLQELDDAIVELLDPSSIEVTLPVSVGSALDGPTELGQGTQWADFQRTGRALLDLLDTSQFDDRLPGMYRAVLSGMTLAPVADPSLALDSLALPITVTHLGESLTRVSLSANGRTPSAFPTFVDEAIFATAATYVGQAPTAALGSEAGFGAINAVASNSLIMQVYASLQGRFTSSLGWDDIKAIALEVLPAQLARLAGSLTDAEVGAVNASSNPARAAAVIDATSPDVWTPDAGDQSRTVTLTFDPPVDELVGVKVALVSEVTDQTTIGVAASVDGSSFAAVSAPVVASNPGTGGSGWVYVHFGATAAVAVAVSVPPGSEVREVRPLSSGRSGIDVAIAAATVSPSGWDPDDTAQRLVTSEQQAGAFSTEAISQPSPAGQPPQLVLTLGTPTALVERVRLSPNLVASDGGEQGSGVPSQLQVTFAAPGGGETFNWSLSSQIAPIDLIVPPTRAASVTLTALTLGAIHPTDGQQQYGFQAAGIEVGGFASTPPPVEVENAFRVALAPALAALQTANVPYSDLYAVSLVVAQAIAQASLGNVGWRLLRNEQVFRAAKWGGAVLLEDPDPAARGAGFAVLQRDDPRAQALVTASPATVDPGEQHPLAGRGVYGRYLLEAPPAALTDLRDLTLNVGCRACFSPALSDTVRGQLADRDRLFAVAGQAVSAAKGAATVLLPSAPSAAYGQATRTITVSLRAHRDRVAQAVQAAAAAIGGTGAVTIAGIEVPDVTRPPSVLRADQPLSFVGNQGTDGSSLGASFSSSPPPDLASTLTSVPVTLDTLGLPVDLAGSLADGSLLAISWAYVPTAEAFYGTLPTLKAIPGGTRAMDPYLPPVGSTVPYLRFGSRPAGDPPPLMSLADLLAGTAIALTFQDASGTAMDAVAEGLVYDVILGLVMAVPVDTATER